MFKNITTAYDGTNATWEIVIMLLVAFILGYLLKQILSSGNTLNRNSTSAGRFAKYAEDDLKIVEGIGPKIEGLLKDGGIKDWGDLAKANTADLKGILKKGGDRFAMHDPSSWADQAALANESRWKELDKYQDLLIGGRTS